MAKANRYTLSRNDNAGSSSTLAGVAAVALATAGITMALVDDDSHDSSYNEKQSHSDKVHEERVNAKQEKRDEIISYGPQSKRAQIYEMQDSARLEHVAKKDNNAPEITGYKWSARYGPDGTEDAPLIQCTGDNILRMREDTIHIDVEVEDSTGVRFAEIFVKNEKGDIEDRVVREPMSGSPLYRRIADEIWGLQPGRNQLWAYAVDDDGNSIEQMLDEFIIVPKGKNPCPHDHPTNIDAVGWQVLKGERYTRSDKETYCDDGTVLVKGDGVVISPRIKDNEGIRFVKISVRDVSGVTHGHPTYLYPNGDRDWEQYIGITGLMPGNYNAHFLVRDTQGVETEVVYRVPFTFIPPTELAKCSEPSLDEEKAEEDVDISMPEYDLASERA